MKREKIAEPMQGKDSREGMAISVEELRKIIRQELEAVQKDSKNGDRKAPLPIPYKADVIQNWLQGVNKANKAMEKAQKGTLNKPDKK